MSKLKKWIIILMLILVMLLILLLVILLNKDKFGLSDYETGDIAQYNPNETIQSVRLKNNYYIIRECVAKFYSSYMEASDTTIREGEDKNIIEESKKYAIESMYNMLDSEYIEAEQITIENLLTKLGAIKNSILDFSSQYVSERDNNINVYIVKGNLINSSTGNVSSFYVIVKVDEKNRTFTIIPTEYAVKKYANLSVGDTINTYIPESIKENDYNTYNFRDVSDDEYVRDLFNQYKIEMMYAPQLVYDKLDNEYRNKKIENIEQFKQYAINNKNKNSTITIKQYNKTTTDSYTQYICLDQNGRYYIFRESGIMNYTVIPDMYTIDIKEMTEKYNSSSNEQKVAYNIKKVFDAINDGDYKYVYNKLDNTFKATNFKDEATFQNYIKATFFNNNTIESESYEVNGATYVYNIVIKNTDDSSKQVKKTIIMKLKEGTDFVMSFNIK